MPGLFESSFWAINLINSLSEIKANNIPVRKHSTTGMLYTHCIHIPRQDCQDEALPLDLLELVV